MIEKLGLVLILIGLTYMLFGTISLFRFKTFYSRLIGSSIVDSSGFFITMIGIVFYKGRNIGILRLLFLIVIYLVLSTLSSHIVARGAYYSGQHIEEDK